MLKDSGAGTPVCTKFHVMHRCAGVVQKFSGAITPVQSELSLPHRCMHRCIKKNSICTGALHRCGA